MNLDFIIDTLLDYIYLKNNKSGTVLSILKSKNIKVENIEIVHDKVMKLPYYDKEFVSTSDNRDLMIYPNAEGFEFVKKHTSYSNYLNFQKKENEISISLLKKSANGSFRSGIGAILAIPLSIYSLTYSCMKNDDQDTKREVLKDSVQIMKNELTKVILINENLLKNYSKKDSLKKPKNN